MIKEKKATDISVAGTVILCVAIVTLFVLLGGLAWWFWKENHVMQWAVIREMITACFIVWGLTLSSLVLGFVALRLLVRDSLAQQKQRSVSSSSREKKRPSPLLVELKHHLRYRYGFFWRYKVRLLLVVGEDAQTAAIAPNLKALQWMEANRTVLLHGGSLAEPVNAGLMAVLRKLRRSRPLDGIVWAVNEPQSQSVSNFESGRRTLQQLGEALRYQPPVYLWQLCDSPWLQTGRVTQPVGVMLPANATPDNLQQQLRALLPTLREQGLQQVSKQRQHDFLLRLGQRLEQGEISRWQQMLAPWLHEDAVRIPLRGLMFSLPQPADNVAVSAIHPHRWVAPAAWQGVMDDCANARGNRVGLPWEQTLCYGLMALIVVWGIGSLVSFAINRQQIVSAAQQAQELVRHPAVSDAQLIALQSLRNDLGRLQLREKEGASWYQRFGLSHHAALLHALLPWYSVANNRLIRDAATFNLQQKLTKLADLPPDSPLRAQLAKPGYDQLKAYLMMVRPEKADAVFYAQVMQTVEPARKGISPALWQSIAPDLWGFYAANLATQPGWKITPDTALVNQARQVLLEQIGQRNAESALYENMLTSIRRNYADMTLNDMTGDTDAHRLFSSEEVVPGMFTRLAWEGGIHKAIYNFVASRRD